MRKKKIHLWLRQCGIASSISLGILAKTASAATLDLSSTNTTGTFTASYSGNSRHYVSFMEVDENGALTHIRTDSPAASSGNITISKPSGVYQYRLKVCDRDTSGQAANCSLSAIRSIAVNISSSRKQEQIDYTYDALGRVISTKENGKLKSSYCYDAAGNRKKVTEGTNNVSCNN